MPLEPIFLWIPVNDLEMVLGINRSNIGGAASVVSFAIEDAVRETFL